MKLVSRPHGHQVAVFGWKKTADYLTPSSSIWFIEFAGRRVASLGVDARLQLDCHLRGNKLTIYVKVASSDFSPQLPLNESTNEATPRFFRPAQSFDCDFLGCDNSAPTLEHVAARNQWPEDGAALCAHRHPPPAAGAEEKLSRISFRQSTLIDKCPTEATTEDTDPYRSPLSLG